MRLILHLRPLQRKASQKDGRGKSALEISRNDVNGWCAAECIHQNQFVIIFAWSHRRQLNICRRRNDRNSTKSNKIEIKILGFTLRPNDNCNFTESFSIRLRFWFDFNRTLSNRNVPTSSVVADEKTMCASAPVRHPVRSCIFLLLSFSTCPSERCTMFIFPFWKSYYVKFVVVETLAMEIWDTPFAVAHTPHTPFSRYNVLHFGLPLCVQSHRTQW